MKLPTLYKRTKTGAIQQWTIEVDGATIITQHGQYDGALQTTRDTVKAGKNAGRANETTPESQAKLQAQARHVKQLKKGYCADLEMAARGEVDKIIEGGILPMKAHKFADYEEKLTFPLYGQPKLDGHRCLAEPVDGGPAALWTGSRRRLPCAPHVEQAVAALLRQNGDAIAWLDGELYSSLLHTPQQRAYSQIVVKDQTVLVDTEDLPKLQGRTVCIGGNGYPVVRIEQKNYYIHRLIMDDPDEDVDHINGDKLDARKQNLRCVSVSQNLANSGPRSNNTSGFKGVHFFKRDSNWQAQVTKDGKKHHAGYYPTAEQAARAYDAKAKELHGEYAVLNFPPPAMTFEKLTSLLRSKTPAPDHELIQFHVFDVPLPDKPWVERIKILEELRRALPKKGPIVIVETIIVNNEDELWEAHKHFVAQGYEGSMWRTPTGAYGFGRRSADILKLKDFIDEEFEIVDLEEGRGKLAGHCGAFVCNLGGESGGQFRAKMVGPQAKLKEAWENPARWRGVTVTVRFFRYTKDGVPFHPRILRPREDL